MACEVCCEKFVRMNKGVVIHEADVIVLVCECPLADRFDLLRVRSVLVIARQEHFVCGGFTHDVEILIDSTLRIRAESGAIKKFMIYFTKEVAASSIIVLYEDTETLFTSPRFTLGGNSLRLVCVAKATLIQPVNRGVIKPIV
jgi:hypothetical protein